MSDRSLKSLILEKTDSSTIRKIEPYPQGVLNECLVAETENGRYFIKSNKVDLESMFEAESFGLQKIRETGTVHVPRVMGVGKDSERSFLVLEFLELDSMNTDAYGELGDQLARMHTYPGPDTFGFEIENTIGTTPQKNQWTEDWVRFFAEQRLGFQLRLIKENFEDTEVVSMGKKLLDRLGLFFKGIEITPSLLHGDLWSGNTAANTQGHPVVFDPACYYGHHEAELSIAKMFGSFSQEFYEAYHSLLPRAYGFEERQIIYQLYHYLNHYNLFGSGYRPACLGALQRLI